MKITCGGAGVKGAKSAQSAQTGSAGEGSRQDPITLKLSVSPTEATRPFLAGRFLARRLGAVGWVWWK
jgi:hypothetical protein